MMDIFFSYSRIYIGKQTIFRKLLAEFRIRKGIRRIEFLVVPGSDSLTGPPLKCTWTSASNKISASNPHPRCVACDTGNTHLEKAKVFSLLCSANIVFEALCIKFPRLTLFSLAVKNTLVTVEHFRPESYSV